LYSWALTTRIIKSRWTKNEGNVARKGDKRNTCKVLVGKFERKRPHKNQGVDENNEYVHPLKTKINLNYI